MKSIFETLPGAFSGASVSKLPKFSLDPMLNAGTLFLVEPPRTFAAGIPASGTTVQNFAAKNVAALGYDPTLQWLMDAETNNGVNSILERSGKGGIHAIQSQANSVANLKGAIIPFPLWFVTYLAANPAHTFGWSIWARVTRKRTTANTQTVSMMSSASNYSAGISNVPFLGFQSSNNEGNVRLFKNAIPVAPVDNATSQGEALRGLIGFGRRIAANDRATIDLPSWIFYRMTLEDLTVSGRSYADFNSQDLAEYTAAFASGGRYAGDTFTAPTVLA